MYAFWRHVSFKNILLNLLIVLVYFLSGKLGLSLAFLNPSTTPIWPPTGIAIAALLFFGYRAVPGIFLGAFLLNNITAGTIITSFGIAFGNTLEGVIGAYLVKKFASGVHAFENISTIFEFTFAAIIATMTSATIGTSTLILGGLASLTTFWPVWITWWLGDMGGALIIAPLILVWATIPFSKFSYKRILHIIISFCFLIVLVGIVFRGIFPYPYLIFPIGVWIAFWFHQKGATASTIIVAVSAILHTLSNTGPFANQQSLNQSLILVQIFIGTFSLTSLTFAAVIQLMKKGEKTITSNERRFQALIDNSFEAVVLLQANSNILYTSPSTKRILGYDPEELQGTTGFNLVIPEDRNKTILLLSELALKPGGVVTTEYRLSKKDGSIIWVEATGKNLLFEPNVNAVVVNFRDITDRKIFEEKLKREKMEDEAMLTSIGEGIIATDNTGKITMVNEATCSLLGWKEKELIGKSIIDAIPMQNEAGKTLDISERPMAKVLSLGRAFVTSPTNYYIRKDKTKIPIRFTLTPITLNNNVVGTIEIFDDITQEKAIDTAKNEFVSIASHQLRTPLATINWYLEQLMKKGPMDTKKQESYFEEVYHASHRMVALINSLLNASRLELGTFAIEPKEIELPVIIDQVLQDLLAQVKGKKIEIEKQYEKNIPSMSADPKLLTIIIQNLLSNAIKYTKEKGKVIIHLSTKKKQFFITITDNGYGIPKDDQSKIFTKMFRADNARRYEPEGTGLGLYIVKKIIDVTGGSISFTSEENKGSMFSVLFPLVGMQKKTGEKQLR